MRKTTSKIICPSAIYNPFPSIQSLQHAKLSSKLQDVIERNWLNFPWNAFDRPVCGSFPYISTHPLWRILSSCFEGIKSAARQQIIEWMFVYYVLLNSWSITILTWSLACSIVLETTRSYDVLQIKSKSETHRLERFKLIYKGCTITLACLHGTGFA